MGSENGIKGPCRQDTRARESETVPSRKYKKPIHGAVK